MNKHEHDPRHANVVDFRHIFCLGRLSGKKKTEKERERKIVC